MGDYHTPFFASRTALNVSRPEYNEPNWNGYVRRNKSEGSFWHAHASWAATPGLHPHIWQPDFRRDLIGDLMNDPDLWYLRADIFKGGPCLAVWMSLCLAVAACTRAIEKWPVRRVIPLTGYYLGLYAILPVMITWHLTMLVNSAVHLWGESPNLDGMAPEIDECQARNNAWIFPLLLGENWHNNHHGAPMSASAWSRWYQIDLTYIIIRSFEVLGLAWDVRVVEPIQRPGYAGSNAEGYIMATYAGLVGLTMTWLLRNRRDHLLPRTRVKHS